MMLLHSLLKYVLRVHGKAYWYSGRKDSLKVEAERIIVAAGKYCLCTCMVVSRQIV